MVGVRIAILGATRVSNDSVRIDSEFRGPGRRSGGDEHRASPWIGVAAVVAAGFTLGMLLWLSGGEPEPAQAAIPTPTVTTRAPAGLGSARPADRPAPLGDVALRVPLGEAVPGFVDTLTALTLGSQGVNVLRWPASESAPAALLATNHGGWSRSVDASGRWFVEIRGAPALAVYAVNDGSARSHEPRLVSGPVSGAAGWSAAWHDSRPGRLAWLACPRDGSGSSTHLYTADLTDSRARLEGVPLPGFPCEDRAVWLAQWGDWGVLLQATGRSGIVQVLLDAAGRRLAEDALGAGGAMFAGVGPDGATVWTEARDGGTVAASVVPPDGSEPAPVPGLVPGERLASALPSPNGSLLAIASDLAASSGSRVTIVAPDTGEVIAQIAESRSQVDTMVWSTDGRFLVYGRWPDGVTTRSGVPQNVELVFYDTEEATAVVLPLQGYPLALRSAR